MEWEKKCTAFVYGTLANIKFSNILFHGLNMESILIGKSATCRIFDICTNNLYGVWKQTFEALHDWIWSLHDGYGERYI